MNDERLKAGSYRRGIDFNVFDKKEKTYLSIECSDFIGWCILGFFGGYVLIHVISWWCAGFPMR